MEKMRKKCDFLYGHKKKVKHIFTFDLILTKKCCFTTTSILIL